MPHVNLCFQVEEYHSGSGNEALPPPSGYSVGYDNVQIEAKVLHGNIHATLLN
jgi:hypothetical protein